MLLILLALLTYSALVIWSASGQDMGMMERKIGQIAMGIVIMIVMAQIPPRSRRLGAPFYIFCIILLVAVDAFGAISKGAALAGSRHRPFPAVGNRQNSRTADGGALYQPRRLPAIAEKYRYRAGADFPAYAAGRRAA